MIKMLLGIVFLCIGLVSADPRHCSIYVHNETLPNTTCMLREIENNEITYYLKKCSFDYVCNQISLEKAVCNKTKIQPNKYPGEYCTASDNCAYGLCQNYICPGLAEGINCNTTDECNPGLFCKDGACAPVATAGQSCDRTNPCDVNLACNLGSCVVQGSLARGSKTSNDMACETFYSEDGVCEQGYKLLRGDNRTDPIPCPEEGFCLYMNNKRLLKSPCECGFGVVREQICRPGEADYTVAAYIEYMKNFKTGSCHVFAGPFCRARPIAEMSQQYFNAYIQYVNMSKINTVHNNSYYTKYLFNYDYWFARTHLGYVEKEEASYMFLIITMLVVILGDILLVWLYFRKWSADAELIHQME